MRIPTLIKKFCILLCFSFLFSINLRTQTIQITDGPFSQEVIFANLTTLTTFPFAISAGSNRLLIATFSHRVAGISSVSYDGTPMTLAVSHNPAGPSSYIYYLVLPGNAALNGTFSVTSTTSSFTYFVMSAIVVSGADTTSPLGNTTTQSPSGNSSSLAISTSTDNLIVDVIAADAGVTSWTEGVNQTTIHTASANSQATGSSYKTATSGSSTMNWSWIGGTAPYTHSVTEFNVAPVTCLSGGITFSSQAEIDDFSTNFPGCSEILGNVTIHESSSGAIANLTGLAQVTKIGGEVRIQSNDNLSNLSGLDNLNSIGSFLLIANNANLSSLAGLGNLNTVGGLIQLTTNASLNTLGALENLTAINGSLIISNNDALTSLTGLHNISTVAGNFSIVNNDVLTDLSAFQNITSLPSNLVITNNDLLVNLNGFNNINSIGFQFVIKDNDALANLSALQNVMSVGNTIDIENNQSLTNFNGFDNINSVGGGLQIVNNNALTDLSALQNITSIGEWVYINGNQSLPNLIGLDNIITIGADLIVDNNDALTTLEALANVTSINGILVVSRNDLLSTLNGIDNINHTNISVLYLHDGINLSTCDIQNICDYLDIPTNSVSISGNAIGCSSRAEVEADCNGILPIELIGFQAKLLQNKVYLNWKTLSEVNNKGFEVQKSINGKNWSSIGFITGNGTISGLSEYRFIDDSPWSGDNYYRLKQIDLDNYFSFSDILNLKYHTALDIHLYPNPTNGRFRLNGIEAGNFKIYNAVGNLIKKGVLGNSVIDISEYLDGVYILQVHTNNQIYTKKLLKN